MNVIKGNIDRLTIRKVTYVILWSVGLFVATFYTLFKEFNFAQMSTMSALAMAEQYLFPLFMAMALFLLDAHYVMFTDRRQISSAYSICFTFFILSTVVSILVDNAVWGWLFFIVAWIALTILKASMLLDANGIEIDDK